MPALLLPLLLAPALAAPRVFLYTMGHGEDLFTRYGHATICVRLTGETSGDCYGYGYTDHKADKSERNPANLSAASADE